MACCARWLNFLRRWNTAVTLAWSLVLRPVDIVLSWSSDCCLSAPEIDGHNLSQQDLGLGSFSVDCWRWIQFELRGAQDLSLEARWRRRAGIEDGNWIRIGQLERSGRRRSRQKLSIKGEKLIDGTAREMVNKCNAVIAVSFQLPVENGDLQYLNDLIVEVKWSQSRGNNKKRDGERKL
jgi:hypothetical protein